MEQPEECFGFGKERLSYLRVALPLDLMSITFHFHFHFSTRVFVQWVCASLTSYFTHNTAFETQFFLALTCQNSRVDYLPHTTEMASRNTLLTLPREIRNNIYEYLTQEITHRFRWEIGSGRFTSIIIRFDNAPILNVFFTNSQLHDEYKEFSCFTQLRASFNYSISAWNSIGEPGNPDQTRTKRVLACVRCLSMHFDGLSPDSVFLWDDARYLVRLLQPWLPRLSVLKVTHYRCLDYFPLLSKSELETITLSSIHEHLRGSHMDEEALPPPAELNELSIGQCFSGFSYVPLTCDDFALHTSGSDQTRVNQVVLRGAWVFTNDDVGPAAITSAELLEHVTSQKRLPNRGTTEVAHSLLQMHGWEDLRGTEARRSAMAMAVEE